MKHAAPFPGFLRMGLNASAKCIAALHPSAGKRSRRGVRYSLSLILDGDQGKCKFFPCFHAKLSQPQQIGRFVRGQFAPFSGCEFSIQFERSNGDSFEPVYGKTAFFAHLSNLSVSAFVDGQGDPGLIGASADGENLRRADAVSVNFHSLAKGGNAVEIAAHRDKVGLVHFVGRMR